MLRRWWTSWWKRRGAERELDDELRFHVEAETQENIARGMTPAEARRQALLELGGVEQVKESVRDARPGAWLETVWHDLRYGARMLRRSPGFTAVAVLTLALAIGANTAIFSVVNAVLLRPLPYHDPERLVLISIDRGEHGRFYPLGRSDFHILREQQRSFEYVAAMQSGEVNLAGGEHPERLRVAWVSAEFFSALGVPPQAGRAFLPGEDAQGQPFRAVVSHSLWQRRLGGTPDLTGRTLEMNGNTFTVVGVAPPGFEFRRPRALRPFSEVEAWLLWQIPRPPFRPPYGISVVGRLKPGVSQPQARAELAGIREAILREYPTSPTDWTLTTTPLQEYLVGDVKAALWMLLGAVGLVLLIASGNVANLLLARAASREREVAIRQALGAGRGRLVRQLLTESTLLALLGGLLGTLLAVWGVEALLALDPGRLPRQGEVRVDAGVLAFTALVTLGTGLLFGLAPALAGARRHLAEALKEGGRSATEGRGRRRLRSALVVSQFTLALMLLAGAGLLVRSFVRLQQVDVGIRTDNVLTMQLFLPATKYPDPQQGVAFYRELLERITRLPGVEAAGAAMGIPPDRLAIRNPFTIEGRAVEPGQTPPLSEQITVTPDYFRALGIPLLRGRFFTEADGTDPPSAMIINRTMAERHFPGEDPIGRRVQTGDPSPTSPWVSIVGVVGDVKYVGLDAEPRPTTYTPYNDSDWAPWSRAMYLVMRTSGAPHGVLGAVRSEIAALDRDLPVARVQTMDELLFASVAEPRFRTGLAALFAVLAAALAAVGIYGVMAYSVNERAHEIGIRMALGAERGDVFRLVIAQGMRLAAAGVALGLGASLALARTVRALLFGIAPHDPLTFAGVALLLTVVALAACYIPARRAMRVEPVVALRHE